MKTTEEIDAEKAARPRPDLVPARAIMAAGRALGFGARKHGLGDSGRGTYRIADTEQGTVECHVASFERHWLAWKAGEVKDVSGLHHLDHAIAQLAIVIDLLEDPPGPEDVEDRPCRTCSAPKGKEHAPIKSDPWELPEGWGWEKVEGPGKYAGQWRARDLEYGGHIYGDSLRLVIFEPIRALVACRNEAEK